MEITVHVLHHDTAGAGLSLLCSFFGYASFSLDGAFRFIAGSGLGGVWEPFWVVFELFELSGPFQKHAKTRLFLLVFSESAPKGRPREAQSIVCLMFFDRKS